MARNFLKLIAVLSVQMLCTVSSLHAQEERNLSLEQSTAYHAGESRPGSLSIVALLDHSNATYGLGETLRMAVKSNEDAYVTVFNVGASGRITQLFPNSYQSDNRIRAGQVLEIPSASSESRIKVTGPLGYELIKVIATSKPVTVIPATHYQSGDGAFKILSDSPDDFDRDLSVVSANQPELKVAMIHQVIKTVPQRPFSTVETELVVPTQGVLVLNGSPSPSGGQRFPLLLAVDKPSYKVGEPITMAITPLKSCYLTVIATDNAGRTRRIFPTVALPAQQISGMQTFMLSGGPSPQTFIAGRPGKETVRAVCTAEAREASFPVRSLTDELSGDEKSAVERDLTVVSNRPTGTVGFTETSFGITR